MSGTSGIWCDYENKNVCEGIRRSRSDSEMWRRVLAKGQETPQMDYTTYSGD